MNRKGFTVVELLASFTLTMIIMVFLFEIVLELKDVYVNNSIKTDVISKNAIISTNLYDYLEDNIEDIVSVSGDGKCEVNKTSISVDSDNTIIKIGDKSINIPDNTKIDDFNIDCAKLSNTSENIYIQISYVVSSDYLSSPVEYNYVYTPTISSSKQTDLSSDGLKFKSQLLSSGVYNSAYSKSFKGASNGSGTYTYSIKSVTLNKNGGQTVLSNSNGTYNGLSLNGTTISGTPTTSGTYVFEIIATDINDLKTKTATISVPIQKISIDLTLNAENKVYDGTTSANVTVSLSNNNYKDNITASCESASFDTRKVGTGKNVTCSSINLSGTNSDNYSLSKTSITTTANITVKELTWQTKPTVANKIYDGTTTATISSHGVLSGLFSGDAVSLVTSNAKATFKTADIGNNKEVTITGYSLTGSDADNYKLSQPTGVTASITKIPSVVTASSASKDYDGTALTKTSGCASATNLVSGHTATCTNSGTITNVGSTTNTLSTVLIKDQNGNDVTSMYIITKNDGILTVNKAASSLSLASSSGTLTYGTTQNVTITKKGDGSLGCSSSDSTVATCSISGTTLSIIPQANTSDSKTATITVTLGAGTNYTAAPSVTYAATVNRQTVTCPSSPSAKTYNGSSQASGVTCPTGSTAGGTTSTTNAGTYSHTCSANSGYKFASACSVSWVINKATPSLSDIAIVTAGSGEPGTTRYATINLKVSGTVVSGKSTSYGNTISASVGSNANLQPGKSTYGSQTIYYKISDMTNYTDYTGTTTVNVTDTTQPTVTLSPNTQSTFVSGGKAVTVTLSDAESGLQANQNVYYAWSTSSTTAPSYSSYVTTSNTAGDKTATITIPASASSSLTGLYYLWIQVGKVSDVAGNTNAVKTSSVFKFDNTNPTVSLNTSSTTSSITAVATASATSGISKYEFSKDNGSTWIDNGTSNTYTFTGLSNNLPLATTKITSLASTATDQLYSDGNGNIRYYGKNPNNYVTFNNESWRIIGVVDGKIKIIKATYITDNDVEKKIYWNSKNYNDWTTSTLNTYLNGTYYDSLSSTAKSMINSSTWYLGGPTSTGLTASGYYSAERDSSAVYSGNQASTTGNIALMYPSDYGYAAGSSCLSTLLADYGLCKNSNWMYIENTERKTYEWTLTPSASSPNVVVYLENSYIQNAAINYLTAMIRPVLYLNSTVSIISGSGTSGNPYILSSSGNLSYDIKARVTSGVGNTATASATKSTTSLTTPTFAENNGTVTIAYPPGCGSTYTCTYSKNSGVAVTVTSTTATVTFTADGTLSATVSDGTNSVSSSFTYILPQPATTKIISLASTATDQLYSDGNGNTRYYGKSPNNYVTFNNGSWRIIGVVDGKLKIIKATALTPVTKDNGVTIGTSRGFYWNKVQASGKNLNDWPTATLNTYLNGTYYNSLSSTAKSMISSSTWYLGGAASSNSLTLTASGYYSVERSSSAIYSGNQVSTTGNIALMYPSDYGYAAGSNCLSTALVAYENDRCENNNWLFSDSNEWTLTPYASKAIYASYLRAWGSIATNYVDQEGYDVRPVLYLNSTVSITSGSGTAANPYILG